MFEALLRRQKSGVSLTQLDNHVGVGEAYAPVLSMHRKLMQSGAISQQDAKDMETLLNLPGGLTLHQYVSFSAPHGPKAR